MIIVAPSTLIVTYNISDNNDAILLTWTVSAYIKCNVILILFSNGLQFNENDILPVIAVYITRYDEAITVRQSANDNSISIDDIQPGMTYVFSVYAENVLGNGSVTSK